MRHGVRVRVCHGLLQAGAMTLAEIAEALDLGSDLFKVRIEVVVAALSAAQGRGDVPGGGVCVCGLPRCVLRFHAPAAPRPGSAAVLLCSRVMRVCALPVFQTRHWQIQACSGVTGDGLVAGVDWIVSDIGQRIFMMD